MNERDDVCARVCVCARAVIPRCQTTLGSRWRNTEGTTLAQMNTYGYKMRVNASVLYASLDACACVRKTEERDKGQH